MLLLRDHHFHHSWLRFVALSVGPELDLKLASSGAQAMPKRSNILPTSNVQVTYQLLLMESGCVHRKSTFDSFGVSLS
jgi:hypothetical protein